MSMDVQRIRTAVITAPVFGPLIRWAWKQYVTAVAVSAPNDCANIPKVSGAGRCMSGPDGPYQLMHNGIKIRLGSYYDDLNRAIIEKLRGHHEPQEEAVFYQVLGRLPDAPVMIEAGSYWGYYSLWFKKERPFGSVFLIEPLDDRLDAGKSNFKANDVKGEFIKAYVGATSKPAHTIKMEGTVVKQVERISIDDFMERYKLSHVDLLHADVQGAELDLLRGAQNSLSSGSLSYIFISTHGARVHNACMDLLAGHNYQVIASHSRAESFTTDGLIVAKNRELEGISEVTISKRRPSVLKEIGLVARQLCRIAPEG